MSAIITFFSIKGNNNSSVILNMSISLIFLGNLTVLTNNKLRFLLSWLRIHYNKY